MSTFNSWFGDDINVERHEDGVNVHFGKDTLGFNKMSSGFSLTPDWNNRHFTLAFNEESILYHITREDLDDRQNSNRLSVSDFVTELYGYIRALAPGKPVDEFDLELVGKVDMDAMKAYLEDHEAVVKTEEGLREEFIIGDSDTELDVITTDDQAHVSMEVSEDELQEAN